MGWIFVVDWLHTQTYYNYYDYYDYCVHPITAYHFCYNSLPYASCELFIIKKKMKDEVIHPETSVFVF